MSNQKYLAMLKKLLRPLNKSSREEIIREIQSHAEEMGNNVSLQEVFGSPQHLADKYLDGAELQTSFFSKLGSVGSIGKNALIIIGGLVVGSILLVVLLFNIFLGDDFDYSNEQAPQLSYNERDWVSLAWSKPVNIKLDQARVVFYWHTEDSIKWDCERSENSAIGLQQAAWFIRHDSCLVYLPMTQLSLEASQANIVLVRPQSGVDSKIHQSELRIAENDRRYHYDFDISESSQSAEFNSMEDAENIIRVMAVQSSIEHYQYE